MNKNGHAMKKEINMQYFKLLEVKSILVLTNSFTVVLKINYPDTL